VYPLYPDFDWATVSAWAWGQLRVVDYLWTLKYVDTTRIAVTGHSRGGKTALLAGAMDERVALTAPNGSGAGGCGTYRYQGSGSESLTAITNTFGYWFHSRLKEFQGQETRLPFDQHSLKALVAPRALICLDATGDVWANPEGTQRSHHATMEVYKFLGSTEKLGLHFRTGMHDQTIVDWRALMDFADLQFYGKKTAVNFDSVYFPNIPKGFSWTAPATITGLVRRETGGTPTHGFSGAEGVRDLLGRDKAFVSDRMNPPTFGRLPK
ncbi:MAG: hypothetical protein M3Y08_14885, partial [Fibrobacterota bacterium]|nr:hypothetical protein [Fibrobacterota bacterium]